MVVRKGAGCLRFPSELEEIGECKWSPSSSTPEAILPRRSYADRVAWLQPPTRRPFFESVTGTRRFLATKWCVLGGLATASGRGSSPKGSHRATFSRSSAETPRGRRRSVVETPKGVIALLYFVLGCLLEFGRPFLQIVGFLGRDLQGSYCKIVPATFQWNEFSRVF
jgi:hypothetical protein